MRRKDKEITDQKLLEKILNEAEVLHLALVDQGEPYIVPMNFGYQDNCLYLHSALEGRKIEIIKQNNQVAFQMELGVELLLGQEACGSGVRYLSVCGTGKAVLIEELDEKRRGLDTIMTKYTGKTGFEYSSKALEQTLVIKIVICSISGKKSGY